MSIELYNNDCLYRMTLIKSKSVDLVFCDLPYGETSCSWDSKINLGEFWVEIDRITKPTSPIFFTTTTRYGAELIASNPKNFRYDLVWVKSASCGFLNAKKMPMRKHEMIYVFYKKLPYYNLISHRHKFLGSYVNLPKEDSSLNYCYREGAYDNEYIGEARKANVYDPPLPNSIIQIRGKTKELNNDVYNVDERMINGKLYHYPRQLQKGDESIYDPPLPSSVVKLEDLCLYDVNKNCYGGGAEGRIKITKNKEDHSIKYEPPLPNSILEIRCEKGKHSTQKPVALVEWILKYYSKEGDLILDPTMGSGTTGVACKLMNRKFIGIEKNEAIFKIACERLNKTIAPSNPSPITDIGGNTID